MEAPMKDIDTLLFDCDGTLIDTYDIILTSMRHTVNTLLEQSRSDEELMRGVGTPLADQMLYFLDGDEARVEEIVELYRQHNDTIHDEGIRSFPNVKDALDELKDLGYKMGVITSKRHFMANRGLEICGIRDYFDVLIGSDDFPLHKPDAGPILEGCRLMGANPSNCAYIGDSPYDIQAANAAGCLSVAALWGMFEPDTLRSKDPCIEISSLGELAGVLAAR